MDEEKREEELAEEEILQEEIPEEDLEEDLEEAEEELTEEAGEDEEDRTEDAEPPKKKLFGKKEKKDPRDEKIADLTDRVQRQMAEFENFRKRTEKEKSMMFEMGARNVIEKILPVIDNFERGIAAVPEENRADPFVEGMEKVYKQLMTELETMGVEPIEAVGKEFDPEYHNAVMQVESEEYDSGIVAQEMQKGYLYHDAVVRHSMVAVVQ